MALTTDPLYQSVGLQRLAALSSLDVNSTRSWNAIKFELKEPTGEILFEAIYKPGLFSLGLGFNLSMVDASNVEVITLRKPNTICLSKVEVSIQGVLASIVRQKSTCLKPVFEVHDADDAPVYRMKGPCQQTGGFQFQLTTLDKAPLGTITRKWEGWKKEIFNKNRDDFTVVFPRELDIKYKAACIGAIVYVIFARSNRRHS